MTLQTLRYVNKNYIQDVTGLTLNLNHLIVNSGEGERFICKLSLDFKLRLPYGADFRSDFELQKRESNGVSVTDILYFAVHGISFLSSCILLIASMNVIRHIIYIAGVISHPETLDRGKAAIVLDFNHCRFIGKSTFEKRASQPGFVRETLRHIRSLNIFFFFSSAHYMLNLALFGVAVNDALTTGLVSETQLFLLGLHTFLDCADVSTLFTYDSKFNLLKILFDKHTADIFYFSVGSILFFGIVAFILFTLYQFERGFNSMTDCVCYVFALMLADSVKDALQGAGDRLNLFLLCAIVFVFHLTFLQIFMALVATSFQKTKAAFVRIETAKATHTAKLLAESKANIKAFKSSIGGESGLREEFAERYVNQLKKSRERAELPNHLLRLHSGEPKPSSDNDLLPLREVKSDISHVRKQSELDSEQNESGLANTGATNLNQLVNDELTHFIAARFRRKSEVNMTQAQPLSDLELFGAMTNVDVVLKNMSFKIAILIRFELQLLRAYFAEFSAMKDKQKFSFILVIASSELCDGFLRNLEFLQTKIQRLQRLSSV